MRRSAHKRPQFEHQLDGHPDCEDRPAGVTGETWRNDSAEHASCCREGDRPSTAVPRHGHEATLSPLYESG